MGRALGDVALGVEAGGLQVSGGLADLVRAFLAAAADEDALHAGVLHLVRVVGTAAQEAVPAEHLGTGQGDGVGFHTAHGQAGHRAAFLLGDRAEVGVDVRDELVAEDGLEAVVHHHAEAAGRAGGTCLRSTAGRREPWKVNGGSAFGTGGRTRHLAGTEALVGHAVGHHDDERLDLARGDEVVHDQVRVALVPPGVLVLTPAVLQVQHRVLLLVLVILRRGVHPRDAVLVRAVGPEEHLLHLAVRHVLHGVEVGVVGRDLDTALPAGGAVVVVRAGIVEHAAVDGQVIVVEALVHGTGGRAHPGAVFRLVQDGSAGTAEAEAHDDGLGLGGVDLEAGEALGVHHRILLARLVELGRLEVFLDDEVVHLGIEALDGEVGLLGLVVLVEQERVVVRAQPGILVGDIPEGDAVDHVLMLAEDLEQVHVLVLLQGALPVGDLGRALVEAEAAAHVLIDPDVQLGEVDVLDDGGIELDGVVHLFHGRAVDIVVGLHADAVDGDAGVLHALDEVVDALALGGLGVIVVVVEQEGVRVRLVGILEGLVDELLAGDLVHRGVAELGTARPDGAVGHGLVHHVPAVDDVLVAVHDGLDVVLHVGVELLLGEEVPVLVLVHPGADLAVPHQGVAAELDAVPAAEVCDAVGILPAEDALLGLRGLGLHRVLGGDAVEFAEDDGDLAGIDDVVVVHGDADLEIVLVGVLEPVGGFGNLTLAPLGTGRERGRWRGRIRR